MSTDDEISVWRQHGFEIAKTVGVVLLSVVISVAGYIWHTTMDRLDVELAYHRKTLDDIDRRLRIQELFAERSSSFDVGFAQRLDRLEELNYGYRKNGKGGN